MAKHVKPAEEKKKSYGCLDRTFFLLIFIQVVFLAGRIFYPPLHKVPWWMVLIPGYPIALILLLFILGFGMFAHTMSKYG